MNRLARRLLSLAALAPLLVGLTGCGGNDVVTPTSPTPPPPPPSAAITVTANGKLVLHPSADRTFAVALETPVKIQETAGGSADWTYARISLMKAGKEIERNDLGSTDLKAAGVSRIAANSTESYAVVFRFNRNDFDDIEVTLGFTDISTARRFTVDVPLGSFNGVNIDLTPLMLPSNTVVRIG